MKQILFLFGTVLAIGAVAAAAYVGYENGQPAEPAAVVKPVTVGVTRGDVAHTVTAPGQLAGVSEQMLGVDVNGRLLELTVRPGSVVNAGEVIARLDPTPYEIALQTAQIQLAQANAQHQQRLDEAALAIEASEAQVAGTQAQVPQLTTADINRQAAQDAEARAAYEYQKAQDRHWEPPQVVESYRLEWVAAQRALAIAEADYNQILNQQWAVSQQVNALSKGLEQSNLSARFLAESGIDPLLQVAVDKAQQDLDRTVVTAPFDGVVLEVLARPGEFLPAGANIVLLTDPTAGEVRTTVIEEDLSLVALGQPAEIYFDARPDVAVAGEVDRIVPQRVAGEARPLYHVYLQLNDQLPEGVYPGMTADASLLIDQASDVLRLPRSLVARRSDGTATVTVWENDQPLEREITTGLRGDVYLTILSGLNEGDDIVGE